MKIERPIENLPLIDYLSMESEMVKTVTEPTLFTWIVAPTVIYGRHQCAEAEVNEAYCREHGIAVVQRQSGGGCVYADRGNLMVSFVSPFHQSCLVLQVEYIGSIALKGSDFEPFFIAKRSLQAASLYTVQSFFNTFAAAVHALPRELGIDLKPIGYLALIG